MSKRKHKKNRSNHGLEIIVFATAILNLIDKLIDLINRFIE